MRQVRTFFLIVVGVLLVIIMVQNASPPVEFRFLNWSYQVSPLLLVVIVLVLGFLGGFITAKMTRGPKSIDEP